MRAAIAAVSGSFEFSIAASYDGEADDRDVGVRLIAVFALEHLDRNRRTGRLALGPVLLQQPRRSRRTSRS